MTKSEAIIVLHGALARLMENSTFSAYAGDNCRQCPNAKDGGCQDPHDQDCPYGMAYKSAENALKETEAHVEGGYAVGEKVAPSLIVIHENTWAQVVESLNKIHDLAGQLGDHPHAGAIQDWVHKVLPCGQPKAPGDRPSDTIVNHEEAEQLAALKKNESNLARCYAKMERERCAKFVAELAAKYMLGEEGWTSPELWPGKIRELT